MTDFIEWVRLYLVAKCFITHLIPSHGSFAVPSSTKNPLHGKEFFFQFKELETIFEVGSSTIWDNGKRRKSVNPQNSLDVFHNHIHRIKSVCIIVISVIWNYGITFCYFTTIRHSRKKLYLCVFPVKTLNFILKNNTAVFSEVNMKQKLSIAFFRFLLL